MEIFELLIGLEKKLHSFNVRTSKEKLNILLSDEFIEIGASGKLYRKKEIIDFLIRSKPHNIEATDFKLNELSPEIIQLIYRTKDRENFTGARNTIRNSLWKNNGDNWQMIFHQGTIINENQ